MIYRATKNLSAVIPSTREPKDLVGDGIASFKTESVAAGAELGADFVILASTQFVDENGHYVDIHDGDGLIVDPAVDDASHEFGATYYQTQFDYWLTAGAIVREEE